MGGPGGSVGEAAGLWGRLQDARTKAKNNIIICFFILINILYYPPIILRYSEVQNGKEENITH
jgi:hypothetical protein